MMVSLFGGVKTVNGAAFSGRRRNGVKRLVAGNLLGDSVTRSWGGVGWGEISHKWDSYLLVYLFIVI